MPFEQIHIGGWLIEVDRKATQAAYLNEHPISACTCDYCQNYFAACSTNRAFSPSTVAFFQSVGIALEKEAEVYTIYANQEKTQAYYGGFYHLVGRIIEKAEGQGYTLIDDQFGVAFSEKISLISKGFPQPALQMEFTSFIPWVLAEKRDALDQLPFEPGGTHAF